MCALLGVTAPAWAEYVTVISFAAANKEAQETAFYKPFKSAPAIAWCMAPTMATWPAQAHGGDQPRLLDVVEVEAPELARGCEEGLFEKLDMAKVGDPADFVPGAVQPCGVGIFRLDHAACLQPRQGCGQPAGLGGLYWDVKKFPGKRGLRWGAKYSLEFALMADGVAPKDVYQTLATPAGVERAFRKLDELKPYIHWWKSGRDPVRDLADGTVVMSSAYNGRIAAAQAEKQPLAMVWSGGVYDFDFWALPVGVWKKQLPRSSSVSPASRSSRRLSPRHRLRPGPTARR
ncbi:extracellular solute-binding protein [Pseudomonas aeruginosa]|uniref:extracellular solute-binding protein n=1 Tax=Pseudomonas aeruginosa TaxID=287 RepID=UPI003D2CE0E2